MSNVALTMLALSAVAVLGLWIGNIKIKGVGLGIGGVLFGGLIVGHFAYALNWQLDEHALHFIKEFGLILFVYTIGIQVGPGFFASLKANGIVLNSLAIAVVVLGGVVGVAMLFLFDIPLHVFLGIYSGAVTNTPSLAAGQQILQELGMATEETAMLGLGYAMAYPFGILGILLSMWLVRLAFKVNIEHEAAEFESQGSKNQTLHNINVVVDNHNIEGMTFDELAKILGEEVMCSRIKSNNILMIPEGNTIVHVGDYLHLVAETEERLHKATVIVGEVVNESLSTKGTHMKSVRIVVTEEKMLGKKLSKLNFKHRFHVVLSRQNRAGVELVPSRDSTLQFGDVLNIVGDEREVDKVAMLLGNTSQKLQHVQMLPIFLGIGLGVLLGSIPIHLPQLPAPLKLGLAGGPLIVAIILSRIGSIGKVHWFMPPTANMALREIGIVLFLAVVGIKSGAHFLDTLIDGDGLSWMAYGIAITLIPLTIVGVFGRMVLKTNYLTLCGLLAGSMTDPPALAFANSIHSSSGASALAYATVYPMVMCIRILSPQLIAVLLWGSLSM